jgi:hypothetical protein
MDNETQFEVAGHAAERFAAEVRKPDTKDPNIRFATLNENVTLAPESDMLVAAPARQYDKPRPFHKKYGDKPDGKPGFKGKPAYKAKGEHQGKGEYKGKSDFKPRTEVPPKAETRGKLFLKSGGAGDRPLTKKPRERPGKF